MQWICECGAVYNYPVEEPVNQAVFCVGCGQFVTLQAGRLSAEDRRWLKKIKAKAIRDKLKEE